MTDTVPAIDEDLPPDEPKVFLSYSRKDRERAQGIADALRTRHFGVFRDTDDILPTEEWRERLQQLIEEADTIVFLMSPQSLASEICAWEVEYATSLNKRIAPIVIQDVEGEAIPPLLARLNFIFCTERDPFENAIDTLSSALGTDIDWVREHTRLSGLARRWQEAGRPKRLLLRGQDIADAEVWRDSRPKDSPDITEAHTSLITESRRGAQARQRRWIAGSLIVALLTAGLSVLAVLQSIEADRQRAEAEIQRAEADLQRAEAEKQRATAENERDRAEIERLRAEEQRDLAERRLREALIERTRRDVADADAFIRDGAQQSAAPLVRDAMDSAISLDEPSLLADVEAIARKLLLSDRSLGFLEHPHVATIGYADVSISPDGLHVAALHLQNLKVWSLATGHLTPVAATGVEDLAWMPGGGLAVVRSKRQPGAWASLTLFEPGTGGIMAETDYDRQFSDAVIFPDQDLAVVSEYRDGAYSTLGLALSDGAVLFDMPSGGAFESAAVSDDGKRIAIAFDDPDAILQLDRTGALLAQHPARASDLIFAPGEAVLAFRSGNGWWLWPAVGEPRQLMHNGEAADHLLLLPADRMVARFGLERVVLGGTGEADDGSLLPVSSVFGLAGATPEGDRFILRHDQQFAVHDGSTGDLIHRIGRVSPPTGGHHLSRDGRYLAIIHQDGFVSVWSTESGRELLALKPERGGKWVQILDRSTGPLLAVVDGADRLGLWRIEPYDLFFGQDTPGAGAPVGDEVAVAGGYGEPLRFWNLSSAMPGREIEGGFLAGTDGATGRQLLKLTGSGAMIVGPGTRSGVRLHAGDRFDGWEIAWGGSSLLAAHSAGVVEVFDTGSGKLLSRVDPGVSRDRPGIRSMAFLSAEMLAILTYDERLLTANVTDGRVIADHQLPAEASRMAVSGTGNHALISHPKGIWRYDFRSGEMISFGDQDGTVRVVTAGPKSAVLHRFDGTDRRSWLVDMETGAARFDLDWGSAYAVGEQDRILVSEDAQGGFAIVDAQTGDVLHAMQGDGGAGGFPVSPYLSADERWMLGVNGGASMVRLIDTQSGDIRASIDRRDGFTGRLQPSADFSAVTITEGIRSAVVDLVDAHLAGDGLRAALRHRFPDVPEKPVPDGADSCDRMTAFVNDPRARTDGVAYESIPFEAVAVCAEAMNRPDVKPVTLFQLARAASLHAPGQDAETVKLLTGLADSGYAAAGYSLAVLMLQGRAQGDRETVLRRLREAGEGGAGIAWVLLSRLAAAGHLDEAPGDILQKGVDAGLPAAMDEQARLLAAKQGRFQEAAELAIKAAEAFAARHQITAAQALTDRAAGYARRFRSR